MSLSSTIAILAFATFIPTTSMAEEPTDIEAGNMIIWSMNPDGCSIQNFTGSSIRKLVAEDAAILRSLAATMFTAQADMATSLTEQSQTEWLYAEYDDAMGALTKLGIAIVDDIARLDRSVLSFPDTDKPLVGQDARRAMRLCRDQADILNDYSGLWTDVWTAATLITNARRDANIAAVPWRIDRFGTMDRKIVKTQLLGMNNLPEPPECLDDLDRRLRERGEYRCVNPR